MPYDFYDTLRNPTNVDRALNGQTVFNTPYIWNVTGGAVTQKGAEPKRVQSNGVASNSTVYSGGSALLINEPNCMLQVPVILDGAANMAYGTLDGIIGAGLYTDGVGGYFAALGGRPPVALPSLTPNNTYCVRQIHRSLPTAMTEMWVAVIDETLNPNLSFVKLDSTVGATPSFVSLFSPASATGGFLCPAYSDGTYPFPFRVLTWDAVAAVNVGSLKPYAGGWLSTTVFDFSLSPAYLITLPNSFENYSIKYSQLEFSNAGNAQAVNVSFGARKFVVPAGRTVTTDISENDYPSINLSASGGALRLNAYAGASVSYNTIN